MRALLCSAPYLMGASLLLTLCPANAQPRAAEDAAGRAQARIGVVGDALITSVGSSEITAPQQLDPALDALIAAWHETADVAFFRTVQAAVDRALVSDPEHVPARAALECLRGTGLPRYAQALRGLYLGRTGPDNDPFRVGYAVTFGQPANLPAITQQLLTSVDDSKQNRSANASAHALALLVDTLEELPADNPSRAHLLSQLSTEATRLQAAKNAGADAATSSLAAYGLAKAVRLSFLPASFERSALQFWTESEAAGPAGGAAAPARQSAELLAASEIAQSDTALKARGKVVLVDAWFNSQTRHSVAGNPELFHYKFNDDQNSGFSFFARAFQRFGARTADLPSAPTDANLKDAEVYILPSPDIPAKNPQPHYMDAPSGDAIERWVRAGGVLLLMENDKNNSEFEHFNTLSERFGIHFNAVLRNTVEGNHFEQGRFQLPAGTGGIFPEALMVYMKEICTMDVSGPAKAVFSDKGDELMAVAHVGKGTVYAVVDPWFYNEYTDGRNLPPEYMNFRAAIDVAGWALQQAR